MTGLTFCAALMIFGTYISWRAFPLLLKPYNPET